MKCSGLSGEKAESRLGSPEKFAGRQQSEWVEIERNLAELYVLGTLLGRIGRCITSKWHISFVSTVLVMVADLCAFGAADQHHHDKLSRSAASALIRLLAWGVLWSFMREQCSTVYRSPHAEASINVI